MYMKMDLNLHRLINNLGVCGLGPMVCNHAFASRPKMDTCVEPVAVTLRPENRLYYAHTQTGTYTYTNQEA